MAVKKVNENVKEEVKVEVSVDETPVEETEVKETPKKAKGKKEPEAKEEEAKEEEVKEIEVEVEVTEPEVKEEPKIEVNEEVAKVDNTKKPNGGVKIRMRVDHKCTIAMERYDLKEGKTYVVPENVKRVLNNAGLLAPL